MLLLQPWQSQPSYTLPLSPSPLRCGYFSLLILFLPMVTITARLLNLQQAQHKQQPNRRQTKQHPHDYSHLHVRRPGHHQLVLLCLRHHHRHHHHHHHHHSHSHHDELNTFSLRSWRRWRNSRCPAHFGSRTPASLGRDAVNDDP